MIRSSILKENRDLERKKNMTNQKNLRKQVAPYEQANTKSSVWQLLNTLVPFFLLWFLAYLSLDVSYVLTLLIAVIAAGFLTRTFIIFHDCTHNSFFKSRKANEVIGTITGIITMFPFRQWQHSHSIHHATSGNLDKRGVGDVWVLTVDEYLSASPKEKLKYRLYRNPIVLFILGPIWAFLVVQRFNKKKAKQKERNNTYLTNVSIVAICALLIWAIGWQSFLLVHLPIFMISGSMGIWLFYVQHQFEDSYFEWDDEWEYVKAAVEGSSFYKLPKVLQWMTGNIGYHHVHHLSPRVPNYHLEDAHNNAEPLKHVPTVTVSSSLKSIRFRLWNEETKSFVGFRDLKRLEKKPSNLIRTSK